MTPSTVPASPRWQWSSFDALAVRELYAVLQLRQRVFVVEQRCAYLDADGDDPQAMHLPGWRDDADAPRLVAYARCAEWQRCQSWRPR